MISSRYRNIMHSFEWAKKCPKGTSVFYTEHSEQLCERQSQLVTKAGTLPFSGKHTSFTQSLLMARLGQ